MSKSAHQKIRHQVMTQLQVICLALDTAEANLEYAELCNSPEYSQLAESIQALSNQFPRLNYYKYELNNLSRANEAFENSLNKFSANVNESTLAIEAQ